MIKICENVGLSECCLGKNNAWVFPGQDVWVEWLLILFCINFLKMQATVVNPEGLGWGQSAVI